MFQLFQTKDGPIFFIVTLVYTCRAFVCSIIRKYLSHVLFWSQLVSVCFTMKFFFSFKIHCLQMFQLFQTRDGPFFSSSHLSTLVTLFLLYHQKIFIPYIVLVTAPLSLFHNEIVFLHLKYIVYKCFSCFRPGMGHFFSSSHLSTLVALFLLYHQKIFVPYIFGCIIKIFEEKIALYNILYLSL